MIEASELRYGLAHFVSTTQCYKHLFGMYYTEGIKYLQDSADCHWLIDFIASKQPYIRHLDRQFWDLDPKAEGGPVARCRDRRGNEWVRQEIVCLEFPLDEGIRLFLQENMLFLPSEVQLIASED